MSQRTQQLQLSQIKQMEMKATAHPDVVSLAQGIPSFDTPFGIKRRAENALRRGVVAKYSLPAGLPELRELIEISLAREEMFYDWQREILVTAGSIEGLTAAVLAISEIGDEIILPEPTYASYREIITLAGCHPIFVPLNEAASWTLNLNKIAAAITPKTRAIFYCNPNNPTGTIFPKEQLLKLGWLAEEHDLFIIADEVYKDFIYDNQPIFSLARLPALRHRVIRAFSFSKSYAMTGWRVGYLHSDEKITAQILKVHDSLVTCAPVISQYAAMGALEMGESALADFQTAYRARRELICRRLDRLASIFEYVKPVGAYFVFPSFALLNKARKNKPTWSSWDLAGDLLEKVQVATVPGSAFGPSGEGHLRLSFGRDENDINRAFDRLEKYFS
mgnify:CR=1 FL=1